MLQVNYQLLIFSQPMMHLLAQKALIIEWLGAKRVTFSGEISFPSKVPEFLHVLFN